MAKRHVAKIKKLLEELFSDTSVPPATTRAELEAVRQECDDLLETLPPGHAREDR